MHFTNYFCFYLSMVCMTLAAVQFDFLMFAWRNQRQISRRLPFFLLSEACFRAFTRVAGALIPADFAAFACAQPTGSIWQTPPARIHKFELMHKSVNSQHFIIDNFITTSVLEYRLTHYCLHLLRNYPKLAPMTPLITIFRLVIK